MTEPFLPSGDCYHWLPDILWLHVISNAVIALSYLLIPLALYMFVRRNQYRLPHRDLAYLFISFIFFCGLSHAAEIYTTWVPAYRLEGWLKAVTASVSIVTALVLLPKLPDLLLNDGEQKTYAHLEEHQRSLEARLAQMNSLYEASLGREERIVQLKKEINQELTKQGLPPRYRIHDD
jgi:hypothetical protein